MGYRKNIEIYQIKDNIQLPLASNPSKMANLNIGDYVIIEDNKVWITDCVEDKNKELFALSSINPAFIRYNDTLFNKEF